MVMLRLLNLHRTFHQGGHSLDILKDISFQIESGEVVALTGPSGAGKSTLLQIIGLLEKPDRGQVIFCNKDCSIMTDQERTLARRESFGFIYQLHHLLPEFTALENVVLPQLLNGKNKSTSKAQAYELLNMVGISDRANHLPSQLSGGERQRIAIARAIANQPDIILADEPTGNLDQDNAQKIFEMFLSLVRKSGLTLLMATHNMNLVEKMDRHLKLDSGYLIEDQN